ncbi:TIGR03571 family LLM class oxidoreductase [Duganella aceris]|uniref:TIGR03571 family LLM class oxidoreductase n=1 Tax=Duganella aceris TaxID=2703883 RepID=A0ABX0FHE3_9BURK|nr:TIGR03571 family LLM class oxidoreductase [Duganella aceris]NGZ83982.1 TIGR03571 family LLM class oxidoreductase [Duganella aceris]
MNQLAVAPGFNRAYADVLQSGLTLGLMTPAPMPAAAPADPGQAQALARIAEAQGFAALWTRDVPLMIEQEGNVSALDDPFVWLAMLAGATERIAIGTAAAVLPLRHPLHLAKAALSLDRISGGRFILGLGSGDRPAEFAAFGKDVADSATLYRDAWHIVRAALSPDAEAHAALLAHTNGHEILPRAGTRIPMIGVGTSRQSLQWIAANADGWASYHREEERQAGRIGLWQQALAERGNGVAKPFLQSLNLDLLEDPGAAAQAIPLGLRGGRSALIEYLRRLAPMGVAHVIINVSAGPRPVRSVLEEIGEHVIPLLPGERRFREN